MNIGSTKKYIFKRQGNNRSQVKCEVKIIGVNPTERGVHKESVLVKVVDSDAFYVKKDSLK